ncbi:MAG: TlpA disulfide reductase family protein [Gammaproteobacteria bacterium]
MKKSTLTFVIVAVLGLGAGFLAQRWMDTSPETTPASAEAPRADVSTPTQRPEFSLKDLNDQTRNVTEWDGQVMMINFWATWCPPCVKEIPAFIELQEAYKDKGLAVIGIAIDNKDGVIAFLDPMGINYPILMGDAEGIALAQAYGNRYGVLPYTVFVDRSGKIVETHRSELTFEEAEAIIKPLL